MTDFDPDRAAADLLHHADRDHASGRPLGPPIVPASLYVLPGEPAGPYQYGRWTNPTWDATEHALATLEGAPVVSFPSGMAAIASVLCSLVRSGQRVLLPSDGYYTTRLLADQYLRPNGVIVEECPTVAMAEVDLTGFDLVFVETPSNPTLQLCDLSALAERATEAGAVTVADNTTMTPLGQRPLDHGIDLIVSSDTKAVNGHSDVLFGHVAGRNPELLERVKQWRTVSGAIPGHFESWLVHRGLETLELRFNRMCDSAEVIAGRLVGHRAIRSVNHPGLAFHPQHALARRQMYRHGLLVGIEFADAAVANTFAEQTRLVTPATSFGGTHTIADRRARWGDQVPEGYVRLSVGCEPTEPLWAAINQTLDAL
ncbi:MAG: cystathionine gamma-lyase [Acidimicrobiia bacterium]|nr:cystathionine gamma-lyase [Acidimicrobiia bacterium]